MILNISGRTDIVAFYSDWLMNRFKEGYIDVRNPFNPKLVSRIMMDDVDLLFFCTKNPIPIIDKLKDINKKMYFHVTLTPYKKNIEPGLPPKSEIIEVIRRLSNIVGKDNIVVRYDPVFISEEYSVDYHIKAFDRICSLLDGYISKILISFIDDYKDTSLYTTESGLSRRFKWRIRYYDDDLTYVVLEKKEKVNGRCHKKSCKLTLKEYSIITSGNITDILYDTNKKLILELARDMMLYNYSPKVIIDYERIAYVEEISNVRVTFDMKISASYDIDHFLERDYIKYYINPSGINVLEVKFDDILPSYIRKIVVNGEIVTQITNQMMGGSGGKHTR